MHYQALAAKWLPGKDPEDPEVLGRALYLDENYWEQMGAAVNQAVAALFED